MGDNGAAAAAAVTAAAPRPAKRRSGPRSKTSPYVGVTQYKRTGNWESHIWIQNPRGKGHQRHLGSYETAEVAARCYDRAALKFRGEEAELNFPRQEYDQDEFMIEHERTEKFKFLDLLRAKFSIQTTPRPPGGAQRTRRAQPEQARAESPESPRTRTVVRLPRGGPGPQRVTVHQRPLPVEPMHPGAAAAAAAAAGAAAAGGLRYQPQQAHPAGQDLHQQQHQFQFQREQQQQVMLRQAGAGQGQGQGQGRGLVRQHSGDVSEDQLLITTAPMVSGGGHMLETLMWPYSPPAGPAAALASPAVSSAATPCSSPGRMLPIPPETALAADLPPPPKLRRIGSNSELELLLSGGGGGSSLLGAAHLSPSLAASAFMLQAHLAYPPLLPVPSLQLQAGAAAAAAAAAGGSGAGRTLATVLGAGSRGATPPRLFAVPANGGGAGGSLADLVAAGIGNGAGLHHRGLTPPWQQQQQQSPARSEPQEWLAPILPLSDVGGGNLWPAGPTQ